MGANDVIHRQRLAQLADELDKLEGFINMKAWVYVGAGTLEDAQAHPCGTAACIAGKAGLMPVFRAQGFRWWFPSPAFRHGEFTEKPSVFFGDDVSNAVFTGYWAVRNIHTPEHVVLVLEAFLSDWTFENFVASAEGDMLFTSNWEPPYKVQDAVEATAPQEKFFPVHGWGSYEELGSWTDMASEETLAKRREQSSDPAPS